MVELIHHNDSDELINAIRSFKNIDRKEIQEMTLEKHSEKKWIREIQNALDKTHDTFKQFHKNLKKGNKI